MKSFKSTILIIFTMVSVFTGFARDRIKPGANGAQIMIDPSAPELEQYAAKELQRYIYLVTGVNAKIVDHLTTSGFVLGGKNSMAGKITGFNGLGAQSYALKRTVDHGKNIVAIAGSDPEGVLYGVYGLLADYYDIGFYLGGDVFPEKKMSLFPEKLEERKTPSMTIRGFTPWTNFPQSDTSYSWEDWKFVIDQTAKMRMNFILVHNYNGEGGHNEPFHNFEWKGKLSRVWMPTAKTGHGWFCPGWDVNQYRFGAADLFDDYDFGSDCGLHNESLTNEQVFQKGVSLFQKVIAYAHLRGVKIGLGLDINLIPGSPGTFYEDMFGAKVSLSPKVEICDGKASDLGLIASRVKQIAKDYPDLDYLLCFQSEGASAEGGDADTEWINIFNSFYNDMKKLSPKTRIAVSGWGIRAAVVNKLPSDVICAPMSAYSDSFYSGAQFGNREYWGCPWLERDGTSSEYYYPYNVHLSSTMKSWQERASNMTGFHCVTWRITDAIEPKMAFVANVPWYGDEHYPDSRSVYREYAVKNYGEKNADSITAIINQNEAFATDWGECYQTPYFTTDKKNGRPHGNGTRDVKIGDMKQFAKARKQIKVIDQCMTTATPAQKERLSLLRCRIAAVRDHIALNYKFQDPIYKDSISGLMQSWVRNFTHRVSDISSLGNIVSLQNRFVQQNYIPEKKKFGFAAPLPENCSLTPIVVSPPTSVLAGQVASVKVRVLDSHDFSAVSAELHWRVAGTKKWKILPMKNRVRAIFIGTIPSAGLVEYYITVNESNRSARFPAEGVLSFVTSGKAVNPPSPPSNLRIVGNKLAWNASPGAFWYKIFRDGKFLTYVAAGTLEFQDLAPDFDGKPLSGVHNYQVTAVDKAGNESLPSKNQ